MQLRVRSITYLAEAVNSYEFVDPRGRDLPRFEAGAHIELQVDGLWRQYSLWNDPAERRRYCIAVLRESESRGGSQYLHERTRVGDLVEVSMPRNNFRVDPVAARHLLIAGGIGIAPIMSMIAELRRHRAESRCITAHAHQRKPLSAARLSRSLLKDCCIFITMTAIPRTASTSRLRCANLSSEHTFIIAVLRN